jgi:hypothetical protein
VEEKLREVLLTHGYPHLKRIEAVPVSEFKRTEDKLEGVLLASGELIECDHVIYADRWSQLHTLSGIPKPIDFLRNREPIGVLQASFVHRVPLAEGIQESFFATMHKETGEKLDKHVWGYFTADGKRSNWTLCLTPEEVEDNHAITKKFRRMKTTLDKIFSGSKIIPEGIDSFSSTIVDEKVRFDEDALFSTGKYPKEPFTLEDAPGIQFFTDQYGPACALHQVGTSLGIEPALPAFPEDVTDEKKVAESG